jgi:hypothetical protein
MAIQAMNIAIKNNNLMRLKRDRFKRRLGGYNTDTKTEYNLPKASAKQLRTIRKRLKEERQIRMLKVLTVTIFLCCVLVVLAIYSANGLRAYLWF